MNCRRQQGYGQRRTSLNYIPYSQLSTLFFTILAYLCYVGLAEILNWQALRGALIVR